MRYPTLLAALVPTLCACLAAQEARGPLAPLDVMRIKTVLGAEVSPDGRQVLFLRTRPRFAEDAPGSSYRELFILDTPAATTVEGRAPRASLDHRWVGSPASLDLLEGSDWRHVHPRLCNLTGRSVSLSSELAIALSLGMPEILDDPDAEPVAPPAPMTLRRALDRLARHMEIVIYGGEPQPEPRVQWRASDDLIEFFGSEEPVAGPPGQLAPRPLLTGKVSVSAPTFTPDGLFVSFIGVHGDAPHREVCLIPVGGGEPSRLTETPHGVAAYAWSPDGRQIAYTTRDPLSESERAARRLGFGAEVYEEDLRAVSLYVWDRSTGASRRLTEGMSVWAMAWSPDGKRLAFGAAPDPAVDSRYMRTRLHSVEVSTGEITAFPANRGKLASFAWSPDGQRLAYIGALDKRDPHAGTLWITSLAGEDRPLTADLAGQVHDLEWLGDDQILVSLSLGVHTHLAHVWPSTSEMSLLPGGGTVAARSFSRADNGRIVAAASTGSHPAEVCDLGPDGATRHTWSNPWLAQRELGKQEIIRFAARDGLTIEGLLIHPTGPAPAGPAPMVIVAHGGPEAHYNDAWITRYSEPGQVYAGRGMYAWYPNYRASTGYGVAFAKADHGDPMGGQFNDHLDAIAHLAERGLIDPKRVGIIGGSYGGYTAAFAATKATEHFAAAVSFVPFTDMTTKWWSSDIPVEFFLVHYREMWPDEQRELLDARSPLTFAKQCRTPLLLAGGTSDSRVHPAQPHMLWRKVQLLTKTPVRYIRYAGEGHGNRRNVNQLDYLVRSLRWLEHYLSRDRMAAPPAFELDPRLIQAWAELDG